MIHLNLSSRLIFHILLLKQQTFPDDSRRGMTGLNDYNYDGRFALSHVSHLRLVITTYPYVRTESYNLIRILTLRKAKSKVSLCNKFSCACLLVPVVCAARTTSRKTTVKPQSLMATKQTNPKTNNTQPSSSLWRT